MIVPEMPALAVSESVINFGNSETIKRVNVSNSGTGKLSWNVSTSETWITVFPLNDSTTTDKKEIIISVTRPGLLPGNYTGTINITSNGGNTALTVNMSVDEFPELNINPASLSFGTDKSSLSFDLKNSGGGKLEWKLTSSENWLLFEPSSGETTTETEQINVSVNRIGLNSGNYNGIINIESNAGNISIPVEMTVEEKPLLSYSPETINFGDQDSTANIEIRNIGNGNLNWQLSGNQPWISLNRANGNTPANQKDDVEINISRNGLAPGDYNGELNISSNGGNGVITVTYSVKENPKLSFSPGAINLNDNDSTASFKIKNVGSGILNWQISTEDDWILIPITNGTTTKNNESEIEFNVNRDLLSPGDYSGNIDITSNGGNGSINVSIKIKDEPKITVSPKSLNFGDKDSSKTFEIKNTGTGNLTWQLSSNETWIKLSASDGITSSKDNDEIEVMVNRENLEPGDYEGSIKITSNAGEETVDVSMKVESKPNISVSAKNLDFDTGFNSLSFKISNKGTGTLEWEIETISDNWLSVNPGKGSITTGETAVFVNIDRNIMSPGNYNTKIDINSNGGKESVNIKVTVEEEPILSVTPASIDFGSTLNSAILLLQNIGTGRLSWSSEIMYIDGDEGWLQMNQTSGNISSSRSINLSVNRSGLSNGSHTADIQIYSDGGNATIHLY
ncbi:MAG: BACON domain-containing protein, partial [Melioribacteraceae bacterium]